jgi:hypothetical protein
VDTNAPAWTRVRAADSILDHATLAVDIEDVHRRRLEAIERSFRSREAILLLMPEGPIGKLPGNEAAGKHVSNRS